MDNLGLKRYLAKLNDQPLLTRAEEGVLLKNIEDRQSKILHDCASSPLFKTELLSFLKSQDLTDVVKLCKKLDDTSTAAEVKKIKTSILLLISALEGKTDNFNIHDLLQNASLSGNLVQALVIKMTKKYSSVSKHRKTVENACKYFAVKDHASLLKIIESIRTNPSARVYYADKFRTTESRLVSRVHEYLLHEEEINKLKESGTDESIFEDILTVLKSIVDAEYEMREFKNELVKRNLRLVVSRAKKLTNRGLDLEDLIQEGNLGLITAIGKHDPSRGTKIGTYATWWIDQAIRRAISNKSKTVRIPTHIEFLQTQMAGATTALTNKLGRAPTKAELAKHLKIEVRVLEKLETSALHKAEGPDEGNTRTSLADSLPSDPDQNPYSLTAKKLLREKVRDVLSTLDPRTEKIIRLRFGIGEPQEPKTLGEITEHVKLTKMGIRVVQNRGLELLKKRGELNDE